MVDFQNADNLKTKLKQTLKPTTKMKEKNERKHKNNETQNKKVNTLMKLVFWKKLNDMYVWLIVVELVCFFFLGSCEVFLKEQVQIAP